MKKTTRKTKSVIEFEPIEFTTPIYGYPIYVYEGDTRLLLNHIKGILKDHDFSGIIENDYGNIIWSQDGSFYLLLREDVTIDVLIRVLLTISIKIMNLVNIKIDWR